jgi:hypothetical protein
MTASTITTNARIQDVLMAHYVGMTYMNREVAKQIASTKTWAEPSEFQHKVKNILWVNYYNEDKAIEVAQKIVDAI